MRNWNIKNPIPPSPPGSGGRDSWGGCGQTIFIFVLGVLAVLCAIGINEGIIKL